VVEKERAGWVLRLKMKFVARFSLLACVAAGVGPVQAEELLVSGFGSDAVGRYSITDGTFLGARSGGTLDGPQGVIMGPDGRLYVANEGLDRVDRYHPRTLEFIDVFVPTASGGLDGPTGLAFGPDGNLYVASFETSSILRFNGLSGEFIDVFVPSGSGTLSGPDVGIIFGPDGNLYVPSFFNNRIIRYNGTTGALIGTFVSGLPSQLSQPRVIIFRPDGNMYVTSDDGDKVMRYNSTTGALVGTFVTSGSGGLDGASGMIFAPMGFSMYHRGEMIECYGSIPDRCDVVKQSPPAQVAWMVPHFCTCCPIP
jgi:DNA-binding beta-propeller fold protein YncE